MLGSSRLSTSSQVRSWCIREAHDLVLLITKLQISPEFTDSSHDEQVGRRRANLCPQSSICIIMHR